MAVINNIQAFHAAIAAVAPIDGVDANGVIFFQPSATAAQRAAAQAAASSYIDPAPAQVPDLALLVQQLVSLGILTPQAHAAVMKSAPANIPPATPIAPPPLAKSILEA